MRLLRIVLILVAVGVILWLVDAYVPMDGTVRWIMHGAVVILLVLWLLRETGLLALLRETDSSGP